MKKFKKIFIALAIAITGIMGMNGVNAAIDGSFEDVSFDIIRNNKDQNTYLSVKIDGATYNPDHDYYAFITTDKDGFASKIDYEESDVHLICDSDSLYNNTCKSVITVIDPYFAKAGDVYMAVYETTEESGTYAEIATDVIKLERPDTLPLSKRIVLVDSSSNASIVAYDIGGSTVTGVDTIKYQIGSVPLENLTALKSDISTGLEKLYTYAKSNKEVLQQGTLKKNVHNERIKYSGDIVDGGYYYVYFEYDTENGKYYYVDDISLFQAKASGDTIYLRDYTNTVFSWDEYNKLLAESEKEELVKNPSTGVYTKVGMLALIVVVGGIAYLVIRKRSRFPQSQ